MSKASEIKLVGVYEVVNKLIPCNDEEHEKYYKLLYEISTGIFEYRIEHKLSYKEMAAELGVSVYKLKRYENGDYNFTLRELIHICDALNLTIHI